MSTMPDAMNAVRVAVDTWLKAQNIKLQSRNRKLQVAQGETWARMSVLNATAESACLGQKHIRDRGIIVVSLFFPLGSGVATADKICYSFRDAFSEWTYAYLETGVGEVKEVPSTEDFYHVNIHLPFRHN